MKVIQPYTELLTEVDGKEFLQAIERAGRTCYKSEHKITDNSAYAFCELILKHGHDSMLEHAPALSVRIICDRGISHEIVRHRHFSFAQESTRYCQYQKELTFIKPIFWLEESLNYNRWLQAMEEIEDHYFKLLHYGANAEQARSVLPNSLKTEIIVTGNVRQWRHFLKLRTAPGVHPQMLQIAPSILIKFQHAIPVLFDDILLEYTKEG